MKRSETEMRMLDDLKQVCIAMTSALPGDDYHTINSIFSQNMYSFNNNNNNNDNNNPDLKTQKSSSDALKNFCNYFIDAIDKGTGYLNLNAKDNNGATLVS